MTNQGGFDPPTGPPAGWYPDPTDPRRQQYWDGRRWHAPTQPLSPAESDHYPDLGDWLDHGFRGAYRRWRAVLVVALVTAPISTVLGLLAIDRLVDGLIIVDDNIEGWSNDRIPVVVTYLTVAVFVSLVSTLALTRLMLDAVDSYGTATTASSEVRSGLRSLLAGLRVVPRAIGWFAVLAAGVVGALLVLAVVAAIAAPIAIVLLVAVGVGVVWLAIKWVFLVVAVVDRRGNPFARSSRVSSRRWWATFGRLLLLAIIMWLISLIIQLIAGGVFGAGVGTGAEIEITNDGTIERAVLDEQFDVDAITITVATLTSIVGTVLVTSVSTAAMALLYRTRNPRA